jgi:periplasmic protein CpxP/Spy
VTKSKLFQWTTLLLAILNIALIAFVLNKPHHRGQHRSDGNKRMIIEKLQFDEEQVVQYEALIHEHRHAVSSLDKEIMQAKQELYSLMNQDDALTKEALIETISENQKSIEEVHLNHFQQIKSFCRTDQQDQFESMTEELAQMFANHPKPNPEHH